MYAHVAVMFRHGALLYDRAMNAPSFGVAAVLAITLAAVGCSGSRETDSLDALDPAATAAGIGGPWRPATTGGGMPLATWTRHEDQAAPGGGPVLALAATNHASTSAFNLLLNDAQRFKDGAFTIHFRADAGNEDRGGGPVWRVRDENNYYVCRANPLENNFRVYVVKDGQRHQLSSVDAPMSSGVWHSIEVTHTGENIACVLDGGPRVEATDATFAGEGGVGLWTKADARTSFVVPAAWLAQGAIAPSPSPAALDTAAIESITGLKGTMFDKEPGAPVFKVTQGRTDVPITVEGRKMEPFMGFTSWASFRPGGKAAAMMAGDLVVFQDEVSPAMDAFFAHGCTVTALHNHFAFEEPKTYFMHFGGEGTAADLARGFRAAMDAVAAVRKASPDPRSVPGFGGGAVPTANAITPATLDAALFAGTDTKGAVKDGMYKATIGRTVRMACGCEVGNQMGVNTWAGFCGTDDSAAVAGDFVTFPGELQPVLRALRKAGINVVAIHNHMEGESPACIFLHYWGKGRAEHLARGVRSALDAQSGGAKH